jgi:hypothetical protein
MTGARRRELPAVISLTYHGPLDENFPTLAPLFRGVP